MDNLRWILLAAGILIVLGIYLYSRLQARLAAPPRRPGARTAAYKTVPGQDEGIDRDTAVEEELARMGHLIAEEAPYVIEKPQREQPAESPASRPAGEVFSIFVLAPSGVPFRGPVLLGALAAAGLEYGAMQIFHHHEQVDGKEFDLFSAANIKEPGTFDLSAMANFTTGGLVLFTQLPGPVEGVQAFDAMVAAARALAASLGGTVCDATRSVLTNQTIGHMREEVIGYQLQQRVANTGS